MTACRICEREWTSMKACHCTGCHEHFASISSFDSHQDDGGCRTDWKGSTRGAGTKNPQVLTYVDDAWTWTAAETNTPTVV